MAAWALLIAVTFASGVVSAVTGFGGAAILLPFVVSVFGARDAVPILTVAQLVSNLSRVAFNRRRIDWPMVRMFSLGSVPAAVIGSLLFASAPLAVMTRGLGVALLVFVVVGYWRKRRLKPSVQTSNSTRPSLPTRKSVPYLGAGLGLLSALVGTVGPLAGPFFLAFGLTKEAYIGTEAMTAVVMHLTKIGTYGGASVLTLHHLGIGAILSPFLIGGTYLGTHLLKRVPERTFVVLVEITLVIAGIRLLWIS